jgi:hypothetical protein
MHISTMRTVRVLPQQVDDCLGDFFVRVTCPCGRRATSSLKHASRPFDRWLKANSVVLCQGGRFGAWTLYLGRGCAIVPVQLARQGAVHHQVSLH